MNFKKISFLSLFLSYAAHAALQDPKQIFSAIYHQNSWGDPESRSGSGSSLKQTTHIRSEITRILEQLQIKTMLDAPCGDFNWMKETDLRFLETYIGIDIVEDLIKNNAVRYGNYNQLFFLKNIITDSLPQVDIIFSRDCLQHLTISQSIQTIKNFKKSRSRYLLTTTYPKNKENYPLTTGYWMPINLQLPPFNFPEPLILIDEHATDWGPNMIYGKSLGLWRLEDIQIEE